MIVNRLLDAFFKTLDVVDAARDRVDQALGREPRPDPWAVEWPSPEDGAQDTNGVSAGAQTFDTPAVKEPANAAKPTVAKADAKPATAPAKAKAKPQAKKKAPASSAPKAKKKSAAEKKSRKGSVDRSGKDFDSPRAQKVLKVVRDSSLPIMGEDADFNGKKVLGRVLWALMVAEKAGEADGMTTADVSALLYLSAKMEVFSTNVGRACRDHADYIETGTPDGRSKRYVLTAAGRTAAASIPTQ